MAKYLVRWTEQYECSKTVEAANEAEAKEKCYDTDTPDKKQFSGFSDWEARRVRAARQKA